MAEMLFAGVVGLVLALRWTVFVWAVVGIGLVAATAMFTPSLGSLPMAIIKCTFGYNAGLILGILGYEMFCHLFPASREWLDVAGYPKSGR